MFKKWEQLASKEVAIYPEHAGEQEFLSILQLVAFHSTREGKSCTLALSQHPVPGGMGIYVCNMGLCQENAEVVWQIGIQRCWHFLSVAYVRDAERQGGKELLQIWHQVNPSLRADLQQQRQAALAGHGSFTQGESNKYLAVREKPR